MRHLQIPPTGDEGAQLPKWALHGHVTMAVIAFVLVLVAAIRCGRTVEAPPLRRVGKAAMHTVGLQVALGIAALVLLGTALFATAALAQIRRPETAQVCSPSPTRILPICGSWRI